MKQSGRHRDSRHPSDKQGDESAAVRRWLRAIEAHLRQVERKGRGPVSQDRHRKSNSCSDTESMNTANFNNDGEERSK